MPVANANPVGIKLGRNLVTAQALHHKGNRRDPLGRIRCLPPNNPHPGPTVEKRQQPLVQIPFVLLNQGKGLVNRVGVPGQPMVLGQGCKILGNGGEAVAELVAAAPRLKLVGDGRILNKVVVVARQGQQQLFFAVDPGGARTPYRG